MSDIALPDAYPALPAPQINFSPEMPGKQRQAAERSVATLVARSTEIRARWRATEAYRAELAALINAPLIEVIESDPAAVAAIATAGQRRQEQVQPLLDSQLSPPASPTVPHDISLDLAGVLVGGVADQLFRAPYHFDWQWHNGAAPTRSSVNRETGQVALTAGAPDDSFIDAHAGFGVSLRADREMTVTGRSLRSSWERYSVGASGIGGHVRTEGGMEMTAFEDGQFLGFAQDRRWSKYVGSTDSSDFYDTGGFGTGEPRELTWTMRPGKEYAFNVGAWVYVERDDGFGLGGFALAGASIDAKVIVMTLFHQ